MKFSIIDKIYEDIISSDEIKEVIPSSQIDEKILKRVENILNIKDLSYDLFIKKIESLFNDSQNVSSNLLSYTSKSLKKNDVENLMFTIESSKNRALNKLKSFFQGELLDPIHVITIKDIFSDLVIEKHKYKKIENEINSLIIDSFVINKVISMDQNQAFNDSDVNNLITGARVSLIKNSASLKSLLDTNIAITNILVQYVQSLSPELFNELMLNYFSLIDLTGNYSKEVKLRIEKINVVKKMIRNKINEFYSLDNIKRLNDIYKKLEKNKSIDLSGEIDKIKMDIEILKISLVKLQDNLNQNINYLYSVSKTEEEKPVVDKIIEDCQITLENMEEIIINAENKINLMF